MITNRIFPRYPVKKLKPTVTWNTEEAPEISIIDVSLSGLQIKSPIEVVFKDKNQIRIRLKQQQYTVYIKKIWEEKKDDDFHYYGIRIKYEDINNYDKWLTFIKALHLFYQKKISS